MKRLIVDATSRFNIRCNDSIFPWGLFWFAKIWVRGTLADVYTGAVIQRRGYKVIEFTPINKQKGPPVPQATFSQLGRIGLEMDLEWGEVEMQEGVKVWEGCSYVCWVEGGTCHPPFGKCSPIFCLSYQASVRELRRAQVRPSGLMRCGVSLGESRSSLKLPSSARLCCSVTPHTPPLLHTQHASSRKYLWKCIYVLFQLNVMDT